MRREPHWRWCAGLLALALAGPARAQVPDELAPVDEPEGAQVLTQGPIHEAFAEPVLYDPKPGPIVPKEPPPPVAELPPEERPAGDNVQWVPGYWAWDDARGDYIWVSGVWRAVPPGQQWVPGYWAQAEGGFQWVPGYWAPADAGQAQYLPEPPPSLENGPVGDPPAEDATWAPGMWVWQDDQYAWRPGYWVQPQDGWMWVPASYVWTPNGYVYNQGFWDYPLAQRGVPFAPVYFSQPIYRQPGFQYTPAVGLLASALASSLFVRPAYNSYYFGNYYGNNAFQSGYYPWYAFHGSRYGYDPLYAYAAARNRGNPRWTSELHDRYRYLREHPDARAPGTYRELRNFAAPAGAPNLALARPLRQFSTAPAFAGNANPLRFERIEAARRQEIAQRSAQFQQFRQERFRREAEARRNLQANELRTARMVDRPASPILGARGGGARFAPPPMPRHPEFDRGIRPGAAPPQRHEPRPETRPPGHPGHRR